MSQAISTERQLSWLGGCYFFFFAILGVMVPYLGVFLDSRGFDAQEIGLLLAILMGTRIIAPNLWAYVADKTGLRSELVKMGAAAAALTYTSFFFEGGLLYLALSLAIYTFFWNAILAQLEVITLETLGTNEQRYGKIRSWGSVGYIILVVAGGAAIEEFGPGILPHIGMVLFIGMLACSLPLPANRIVKDPKAKTKKLVFNKSLLWFLFSAMLLQMSVGPFYGFFVLYLKQAGYSETQAGIFVALGVAAEILMFMFAPKLLARFGIKTLLAVSIGLTSVRWLLMAVGVDSLFLLGISQILHAFTFGLTHAASIQFIHQHFDVSQRSQGQALYASVSFGLGGALGTWMSGYLWGDGSTATWTWLFAAACAFASMIAVYFIPMVKGSNKTQDEAQPDKAFA